jgi:surface protein
LLDPTNTLMTMATSNSAEDDISPSTTKDASPTAAAAANKNSKSSKVILPAVPKVKDVPPGAASPSSSANKSNKTEYQPRQMTKTRRTRCLQILVILLLVACIVVIPTFLVPADDAHAAASSAEELDGGADDDALAAVGDDDGSSGNYTDDDSSGHGGKDLNETDETEEDETEDIFDDEDESEGDEETIAEQMPPPVTPHTIPFQTSLELQRAVDLYLHNPNDLAMIIMYGYIEHWNVSAISDFSSLFDAVDRNPMASRFNGDISRWDMSAATSIDSMFAGAGAFNQNISAWNVSSVSDMSSAFNGATEFSQDLCAWADLLPTTERVSSAAAFEDTACPVALVPVQLAAGDDDDESSFVPGPFCFPCTIPTCIQDTDELYDAVDMYLEDPTGALTANQYGHPIGTWCVNEVTDFSSVFSVERNELAADFDEDLSGWGTCDRDS